MISSFSRRELRLDSGLLDRVVPEDVEMLRSGELAAKRKSSSDAEDTEVFDPCALVIPSGGILGW